MYHHPFGDVIYKSMGDGDKNINSDIQHALCSLEILNKTHTLCTDIWFVVSVPVLSEQITEVQPRVSTDGRLRTIAFFLAILWVPVK